MYIDRYVIYIYRYLYIYVTSNISLIYSINSQSKPWNINLIHLLALGTYVEDSLSFICRPQLHGGVRHANITALTALSPTVHLAQFVLLFIHKALCQVSAQRNEVKMVRCFLTNEICGEIRFTTFRWTISVIYVPEITRFTLISYCCSFLFIIMILKSTTYASISISWWNVIPTLHHTAATTCNHSTNYLYRSKLLR